MRRLSPLRNRMVLVAIWMLNFLVALSSAERLAGEVVPTSEVEPQGGLTVDEPPAGTPLVKGVLSVTTLESGSTLYLILVVDNTSSHPIQIVAFEPVWRDQLKTAGDCWANGVPLCGGVLAVDSFRQSTTIGPGESRVFRGRLVAYASLFDSADTAPVRAVIVMHQGGRTTGEVIEFGPLTVKAKYREVLYFLAATLVVAAIPFLFQRFERRRAEVQQTWLQMVAKLHEYAEQSYMPISGTIAGLRLRYAKWEVSRSPVHKAELLPRLIGLSAKVIGMGASGGWYFQSRAGEAAAETCWGSFYRLLALPKLGDSDLRRLSVSVRPKDHELVVARVLNRKKTIAPEVERVQAALDAWLESGFSKALGFLTLLELTIDYEVNASLTDWYREKERFPSEQFQEELGKVAKWCSNLSSRDASISKDTEERLMAACQSLFVFSARKRRLQPEWWSRRKFKRWLSRVQE